MTIADVKLPKKYKNRRVLYEQDLDAWRLQAEATFATIKKNLLQIGLDSFTAGYDYKNNGVAQKPISLEDRINEFSSGTVSFPGTISPTFTINTAGFTATLDTSLLTANRVYEFPDASGTFALLQATQTFTGINTFSNKTVFNNGVGFLTSNPLDPVSLSSSLSGSNLISSIRNTSNTAASGATMLVTVAGTSGGDPTLNLQVAGSQTWTVGIDTSDGGKFKIGQNDDPGTSPALVINPAMGVGLGGVVSPGAQLSLPNTQYIAWKDSGTTGSENAAIRGNGNTLEFLTNGSVRFSIATNGNLSVSSSVLVTNLNAQYLNGHPSTDFFPATGTTGTGNVVLDTNATIVTPTISNSAGSPTIETPEITSPAVTGTLTFNGGTGIIDASNTIVLQGNTHSVKWNGNINLCWYPEADNVAALGNPIGPIRWTAVYAVNGTIQTSDKREKKKIVNSDLGLDFVRALRPISYHWKKNDNGKHYGFIAQEILETLSGKEFSGIDQNEKLGLNYSELIAPIVKAIQDLDKKVEKLIQKGN